VAVTSSADGVKLAAVIRGGDIVWTSNNRGADWAAGGDTWVRFWTCITSSDNGDKLAATAYGGEIWTSEDSGT
jgi:hypothetical protein